MGFTFNHSYSFRVTNEVIEISTLIVLIVGIISNLVCIIYLIQQKKYKLNSKYEMVLQFFLFKLIKFFKLNIIIQVFKLKKYNNILCFTQLILDDLSDSCSNFVLFTIWLTLMSDRNMIGLKFLQTDEKMFPRSYSILSVLNIRFVYFFIFYFFYFTHLILYATNNELTFFSLCSDFRYLNSYKFSFYVIIFSFWLLTFSLLLWNFFGGYRDPIFLELNSNQRELLRFFKCCSILLSLNTLVNYTIEFNNINSASLISTLFGSLVDFLICVLFLNYEQIFKLNISKTINMCLLRRTLQIVHLTNNGINL